MMQSLDPRRLEEVALNALQSSRQLFYDGWLVRVAPGATKRARSVNAFFGSTLPLEKKIAYCENLYASHALPTLFRLTPFDHPLQLDSALAARGYERFDDTLVQTLDLHGPPEIPELDADISIDSPDLGTFVAVAGEMRGTSESQQDAHRSRLEGSPLRKCAIVVRSKGRPVCTAQLALEDGYAGLFDVGTATDAFGNGYATIACAALLSWAWQHGAHTAYLQVGANNAPALAVYRKLGFATVYTYHYRGRPGECK